MLAATAVACAPIVVGVVAAGTALVVTDRRTTGSQVDDQTIQLRVANELGAAFKDRPVHINVNSFDRKVLLTGEVPDEAVQHARGRHCDSNAERAHGRERTCGGATVVVIRSHGRHDTVGKVRAAFINTREIAFNSVEIVTERRIVYLLGFVTEEEGKIAALVASKVSGVQQVVKVFDIASREEVDRRRAIGSSAAPAAPPAPPAVTK